MWSEKLNKRKSDGGMTGDVCYRICTIDRSFDYIRFSVVRFDGGGIFGIENPRVNKPFNCFSLSSCKRFDWSCVMDGSARNLDHRVATRTEYYVHQTAGDAPERLIEFVSCRHVPLLRVMHTWISWLPPGYCALHDDDITGILTLSCLKLVQITN